MHTQRDTFVNQPYQHWSIVYKRPSKYIGQKILGVSLDCSVAFDRSIGLFRSMVEAMGKAILQNCIINWYKYIPILKNRKVLAEVQGQKYVAYPTKGPPQRGVLSPLIWIVFMDSIQSTFDIRIMPVSSYLILLSNVILMSIGTLIVQYSLQKQYTVQYYTISNKVL